MPLVTQVAAYPALFVYLVNQLMRHRLSALTPANAPARPHANWEAVYPPLFAYLVSQLMYHWLLALTSTIFWMFWQAVAAATGPRRHLMLLMLMMLKMSVEFQPDFLRESSYICR